MEMNKYIEALNYNQERQKIKQAVGQLKLLYYMLSADDANKVEDARQLLLHAQGYMDKFYPEVYRPENETQEREWWNTEA